MLKAAVNLSYGWTRGRDALPRQPGTHQDRGSERAAAGQDRSSQLGGITPKHTACCEQLWEASEEEWLLEKQSFLLLSMGLNSQHDAFVFCGD